MRSQVNTEIVAVKTNDLTASNTVRTFGGAIAGVENYSEKHCEEHESHIHFCSTAEVYFQDCFISFPWNWLPISLSLWHVLCPFENFLFKTLFKTKRLGVSMNGEN